MARIANMMIVCQNQDYPCAPFATGGQTALEVTVCACSATAASSSTTVYLRVSDDQENWLWLKSDGSAVPTRAAASALITYGASTAGPATAVVRRDNGAAAFPFALGWAFVQVMLVGSATPANVGFMVDANMFSI